MRVFWLSFVCDGVDGTEFPPPGTRFASGCVGTFQRRMHDKSVHVMVVRCPAEVSLSCTLSSCFGGTTSLEAFSWESCARF